MQNGSETEFSAEKLFIGGKFLQGLRNSLEKKIIHQRLILIKNRTQLFGNSENNMEIAHVEKILFLLINPNLFGDGLALGTMAIAAGVV